VCDKIDNFFLCCPLFRSPLERNILAGKSSDWCCYDREVLDKHSVVASDAQEASCLPKVEDVTGIFCNTSDFGWIDGCAVFGDSYAQEVHLGLHKD